MDEYCDFVSDKGISFRAVLVPAPGPYRESEPVVKFYDLRYMHTPNGQFTGASYFASTLMDDYERLSQTGLCLQGGVSNWDLDGYAMRTVLNWMMEVLAFA